MKAKRILGAAATAGAAVYAGACGLLFYEIFHRKATIPGKIFDKTNPPQTRDDVPQQDEDAQAQTDSRLEWMQAQSFREVTLQSADGKTTLKAHYLPAETQTDHYVICAHGYRSHGRREFRLLAKYYHDRGFNILLVDHRASGESGGALITFGVKESADLLRWIDWVRDECASAQIVLHGISMGAATVLMLSDREEILPNVKYIVSDCAFTGVTDQFRSVLQKADIPSRALIASVDVFNRLFSGFSLYDAQPKDHVQNACVPILFTHGGGDDFVPTEMGYENYAVCTSPKALLIVDGAGHARSYPTDSARYEEMLRSFEEQYLDADAPVQAE